MYNLPQKLLVTSSLFLTLFVVFFFLSPSSTFAARTCCTVDPLTGGASGNCDGCRAEGVETKNYGDSCGGAANCVVCGSGHPKSNSCGGTGGILCTAAVSPNPVNVAVNETKKVSVNVKAYSTKLGFVRFIMGNTATAIFTGTTSPTNGNVAVNRVKWNTCCGFSQTTKTFTADVKGVAAGTTTLTVDAQYDGSSTPKVCGTASVVVGGTAAGAPTCKPGAKCVSNTGVFKSGSYITCSMPTLSSTELGGGTASYQLECTPYKSTTAQTKIAKTSSNGTFGAFGIASGTTRYDCAFRYCLTKSGATTCSAWGKL